MRAARELAGRARGLVAPSAGPLRGLGAGGRGRPRRRGRRGARRPWAPGTRRPEVEPLGAAATAVTAAGARALATFCMLLALARLGGGDLLVGAIAVAGRAQRHVELLRSGRVAHLLEAARLVPHRVGGGLRARVAERHRRRAWVRRRRTRRCRGRRVPRRGRRARRPRCPWRTRLSCRRALRRRPWPGRTRSSSSARAGADGRGGRVGEGGRGLAPWRRRGARRRSRRARPGGAALGDADGAERAGAGPEQEEAGADHQEEERGHGELRAHRVAAGPGEAAQRLPRPGRLPVGRGGCVEDARFEVGGRLHEREDADRARRPQAGVDARAAGAALDVALQRRVRQLVELVVEIVDDVLVELLAIPDPPRAARSLRVVPVLSLSTFSTFISRRPVFGAAAPRNALAQRVCPPVRRARRLEDLGGDPGTGTTLIQLATRGAGARRKRGGWVSLGTRLSTPQQARAPHWGGAYPVFPSGDAPSWGTVGRCVRRGRPTTLPPGSWLGSPPRGGRKRGFLRCESTRRW